MHLAFRLGAREVAAMADAREPLRKWLRSIARTKGITLTELAEQAEASQSTITRFVNDPKYQYDLSTRTIRKIEEKFGVPAPRSRTFSDAGTQGFEIRGDVTKHVAPAAEAVMAPDEALDLHGIQRGDLCEYDAAAQPMAGDLVVVELRPGMKTREFCVRIFDAPFLMAHSTNYDLNKPMLYDPSRARVAGVVTRITRQVRSPG